MSTDIAVVPHALGLLAPPRRADESTWGVDFDPDWRSFPTNMHGGVLVATFTLIAGAATDRWPAAVSVHLHAAVQPGPAQLEVQLNRTGRTATSAGLALIQRDRRATGFVQLTADRPGSDVRTWPDATTAAALAGPAPENLEPVQLPVELALMAQQLDIRPTGTTRPLAGGDTPELSAWVRLRPGVADSVASSATGNEHRLDLAAMLLDVLPPAIYATRTAAVPIPTIELSAHFPPVASSGEWFHVRQWTSWGTEAMCVDSSEVWDSSGRLVGEARQLRRILAG